MIATEGLRSNYKLIHFIQTQMLARDKLRICPTYFDALVVCFSKVYCQKCSRSFFVSVGSIMLTRLLIGVLTCFPHRVQFRALSDQFYRTPEHHKFVRQQVINQVCPSNATSYILVAQSSLFYVPFITFNNFLISTSCFISCPFSWHA